MTEYRDAAQRYLANDILSLPIVVGDKKPNITKWKKPHVTRGNYNLDIFNKRHGGIGVITGDRSLGLEVLDVDLKNSSRPKQLWEELSQALYEYLPEFCKECTVETTTNGGYHFIYRTEVLEPGQKLAHEKKPDFDPNAKPKSWFRDIIELMGEGDQVVTYPTPGYKLKQGGLDKPLYVLSAEDRETLLNICRSFDEKIYDVFQDDSDTIAERRQHNTNGVHTGWITDPWTDYNNSISESEVISMIEQAGFKRTRWSGGERIFFKRIGSSNTQGANWHTKKKVFYAFTDNSLLESDKGYDAVGLLKELKFNGDGKECFKWLVNAGYGLKLDPDTKTSHLQPFTAAVNASQPNPSIQRSNGHTAQKKPIGDDLTNGQSIDRLTFPMTKQPLSDEDLARMLANHEIRVTDQIDPPKAAWVQLTDESEAIMGTLGNFSLLIGKAKSRKSFLIAIALATALSKSDDGFMGLFKGCLPDDKQTVLYFDTEQGKYHVQLAVKRICKMIGVSEPDNLKVYGLRSLSPGDRLATIDYAINTMDGIGFVAIDGVRDLVTSINDEEQASMMSTKLLQWTEERQIHITTVLHQNKGDNNARGHLGSELVNKAETTLSITKSAQDKDISIVESEYCRNKDPEPFAFEIIEDLPVLVENYELRTESSKNQFDLMDLPPAEIYSMLNIVFSHGEKFSYNELVTQVGIAFKQKFGRNIGGNRIKKLVTHCKNQEWLIQEKDRAPYQQGKFQSDPGMPF